MRYIYFVFLFLLLPTLAAAANVAEIEYFFDTDPGVDNGTSLTFAPNTSVTADFQASVSGLDQGIHHLYIRAKDDDGDWGLSRIRPFYIFSADNLGAPPQINGLEYSIDETVPSGQGTGVTVATPGNTVTTDFTVNFSSLSSGIHYLYVRGRDTFGTWGQTTIKAFYVLPAADIAVPDITRLEYFIDTDPGYNSATAIPIISGPNPDGRMLIDLSGYAVGNHTLEVRALDANGLWSPISIKEFEISDNVPVIDSDNDGIHDDWELFFFGDLTTVGAGTDYDGDGYTDVQEYLNWAQGINDSANDIYNPTMPNEPGGPGYNAPSNSSFWTIMLPAILNMGNKSE